MGWPKAGLGVVWMMLLGIVIGAHGRVTITPLSPPRTVSPGDVAIHVFHVSNASPTPVEVALMAVVPLGWGSLGVPGNLVLEAEGDEPVFLTVIAPRTAVAGPHTVRLEATWSDREASGEATVRVLAVAGVLLGPPSAGEAQPGGLAAYEMTLLNRGNVLDRFSVEASSAHGWSVRVDPPEMSLRPGETGIVRLTLSVPAHAEPGRDLLGVAVRSGEGAEARAAWYTTILPPGPEAIVGTVYAELEMRLGGRLGYDPVSGQRLSLLTLSGQGEVHRGDAQLGLGFTGPWGTPPYTLSRFSVGYDQGTAWVEAGDVGLDLSPLLLSLGAGGIRAGAGFSSGQAELLMGWQGEDGRFGLRGVWQGDWGELGFAARRTRGEDLVRTSTLWVKRWILDGVAVRGEGGIALAGPHLDGGLVIGLTAATGTDLAFAADLFVAGPRLPSPYADRSGFSVSGQFLTDRVGFRFTARWEHDNVLRAAAFPTVARSALGVAVDWTAAALPVALFSTTTLRRAQGLGYGADLDRRTLGLDLAARIGEAPLAVRLGGTWRWEDDFVDRSRQHIEEYSQRVTWISGSSRTVLTLTQIAAHQDGTTSVAVQVAVDIGTTGGLVLGFRHGLEGGALGAVIPLPVTPVFALTTRLDLRWNSLGEVRALYAEVGFEHTFVVTPPFLPVKGWIEGRIFVDANLDGHLESGGPAIAGAVLAVEGTQVASGIDGRFLFPPLAPGTYALTIDRLPPGFRSQVELPIEVRVSLGGRTIVYIPCEQLGGISGAVYDDLNRDGVRDGDEPGLGRVRVVLIGNGEALAETYTNPLGLFAFVDLPAGRYEVQVDGSTLQERYELTTPKVVVVELEQGDAQTAVFGVWQRPRPVVVVFQPPVADFEWSPRDPRAGEPVAFDAGASQGRIARYDWDFTGDGEFDADGPVVVWAFEEPGFHLVTLVVTDDSGLEDSVGLLIQVVP